MITDPEAAAARAVAMVAEGTVDVLVVHSDTDGALEIARATRSALDDAGIDLVPVR